MLVFNMNSKIQVKLTDYGRTVLRGHYLDALKIGAIDFDEYEKLMSPPNGLYHFQMHQFINIFGGRIAIGDLPAVEGCRIYFNEKDLETVDDVANTDN